MIKQVADNQSTLEELGDETNLKERAHGSGIGQLLHVGDDHLLGSSVHALLDHVRGELLHAEVRHLLPTDWCAQRRARAERYDQAQEP